MSLRKQSGQALIWDLIGNYGGQISAFIISIFLARLLEPKEFGLVGMSLVFINIMKIFMDLGLASALVQNRNNTSLTYSSVFYINIVFSFFITAFIYLIAPYIGEFYDNPEITNLVRLISLSFIISGFNIVQHTILKIKLDFRNITFRDLVAQAIAGVTAISLAYKGYGVYALVVQLIIAELIKCVLLWSISDWRPKLEFSYTEVRGLVKFSSFVLASQFLGKMLKELDTLVVGKLFSPAMLGFYSRANSLNMLIVRNSSRSISNVFFPVLSKINDDELRFKRIFLRVINLVSGISILITGVFFLAAEEIIIGLFGPNWKTSVLIFQVLALKGFTYPINSIIVNAFLAKGKSKQDFIYGNVRKALRLIPLFIAYLYGFDEFLYALVIVSYLIWLFNNYTISITLKIPIKEQMASMSLYVILGFVLVASITAIFPAGLNYWIAALKVGCFGLTYLGILYLLKSVLIEEGQRLIIEVLSKFSK